MDRKRPAVDAPVPAAPNKDQFTCERERERFLKDLRQFHEGRGTTVPRWPYIGGKPIDLHALYKAVTQLGGWEKVSNDDTWTEIQEQFGIPLSCSNADYALRQIYVRYLNAFERLHHFSQDPDSREDSTDLDDLHTSRKKATGLVSGVAVTYNYQQHILPDSTREMLGLPKELSRPSEYARIERSLMSGLPNELDFAVNVCLLLSTESRHTLKGTKALRIVELLLSHVGISKEADLSLIWLIPDSKLNFLKFWNDSIEDHEVKELLCPECLLVSRVEEYQAENAGDAVDSDLLKILNLGRGLGTEDREVQRVIQLAVIVRNLSFEEENLDCFASSLVVFRFLMLCIYSSNGCIHQLALDAMANIAFKMSLDPVDCGLSQLVIRTISTFLASHDKFEVVSALEMLSRLCQVESNEDAICSQLGDAIYEHLIQLLTIQDLQLIVSALETTYQLSEIGAATSSRIANVRSSVDVLIALLTVEAQSYGPCTLPGIEAVEDTVDIQTTVHNQTMGPPPARLALPIAPRPALPLPCIVPQVSVSPGIQPPQTPRPRVLMAPVSSTLVPQAVSSTPRQAPVSAVPDNEATACNWLLTQYELSADSSLKKMEMYRKYASVFGVYGLQNLVSPTCFASCIRAAFPSVEQELVDKDGANEAVYKGLVARQKPGPFSPATGDLPPGHQVIPSISSGAALGLVKVGQTMTQLVPPANAISSTAVTFPAIQHILQNNQGRMDSLVTVRSDCLVSASAAKTAAAAAAAAETNLVKTLLASKVAQHLNRLPVEQPDRRDADTRMVSVDVEQGSSRESDMADGPPSNPRPVTHIRLTLNQNSHCGVNRVGAAEGGSQGVLSEHSYIQTTESFACAPVNGNFVVVAANQSDGTTSRCNLSADKSVDGLAGYYADQGQGSDGISGCFSLNCYKQNAVGTAENASATRSDSSTLLGNHQSTDSPVVVNGTFSAVEISGKNHDSSNCAAEQLNGTDSLPVPNSIVKDLVNGNCLSENCDPESARLPDDGMKTRLSGDKNEPEMQRCASARDTVSPFPHIANVDGLFDDDSDKTSLSDDKTAGVDSKHHCHNPGQSMAAVEQTGSQMPQQFEMDCNFPESATDNSEILLLEDFTVAREEVLMSDILTQTINSSSEAPSVSNPTGSYLSEPESNQLLVVNIEETCTIPSGVQNSIDSAKNSLMNFTSTSQPLPIVIPANIQAKLASYQDGSALLSMMNQSQVPFSAMHSVVSQSSSSSSTTFQRPLINHNYVTSFAQAVPASDTSQQHALHEAISNLQGNCEISKDLQSVVPFSGETNPGSHIVYQTPSEDQAQSTGMTVEIPNLAVVQPGLNNPRQMVLTNPHSIQSTAVPGIQQQNSSSIFALSSTVSSTSQGSRLQFMTTSNSMRFPQLHRFVTTTTPGRIIIQRAQIVPQGAQQPQLQGQQPLRPLQQPFFQRFIVSQAGGLPQRQILIQSSPVLMHQGAQGTGQARPVFVPQRDQSSTGQPVVIPPAGGQMLSQPQQRPVSQASQLAAYRLAPMASHSGHIIQHQMIGQPGQQGILSRPLVVPQTQAGTQQGQMVTQPGQQNAKPADQPGQGHGQVIVSNQAVNIQQSQMVTHQGQSGHIFTQQGQILVGQQGQILCHPGQAGQSQNTGPVVIQHGGGQFVLHGGSHNLPGCLMSIPVSSFQHGVGIKRLAETSKDQTVGPSLTQSLCLSTSTVAGHVVTATVPLNSGLSVATGGVQQSPASGQVSPSSVSSGSSAKKRKPPATAIQPRLAKKRKKDGEDQGDGDVGQGRAQVQYLCEWNGCQRYFGSFNSIYQHATKDHFEAIKESSITCEWAGCDTLRRQRWSFMTHLQDRHINEASLKAAATRRQQQASGTSSPSPQASTTVPATAVYPPNAALQAIRRFSARPPFIELTDAKEGPISKHIHLTSALILRNLARYSSVGRSLIKKHEKHLALIAFSETESSSAISNCLWELHRH